MIADAAAAVAQALRESFAPLRYLPSHFHFQQWSSRIQEEDAGLRASVRRFRSTCSPDREMHAFAWGARTDEAQRAPGEFINASTVISYI